MSAPTVDTETRLVFAPEGKAWVGGNERYAGEWEDISEARIEPDQDRVLYPFDDGLGSNVVAVPAGAVAPMADVMTLAARVEFLHETLYRIVDSLEFVAGAASLLKRSELLDYAHNPDAAQVDRRVGRDMAAAVYGTDRENDA